MTRAVALAALLVAAVPARGGGVSVVATSTDLGALVRAVGGDRVSVATLAPPLQDPHTVEVKAGQLARLRGAALLIRVGLDHEPWLPRAVAAAGGLAGADLDLSRSVRLLQTETPRGRDTRGVHVHGYGNPHYWLDPANARPMTAAIAAALARLAPDDAAVFETNRGRFLERLDAGLARWSARLAPHRGTRIVVVHDSWTYFADRFGLIIAATVEPAPGMPPTPASFETLVARMRAARIRVLIAEPYSDASLVSRLAARTGARPVTLVASVEGDPAAPDYVSLFDLDVERLARALEAR